MITAVLVDALQCTTNQVILVPLLPSGPGYREQRPTWGPSTIRTHAPLRRPLLVASSAWPPAASRPSARLSFVRLASCSSGTAGGSGRRRRLEVPHAELLISGQRNNSSENCRHKIFFWVVSMTTFSLIFTRVTRCHSFFFFCQFDWHSQREKNIDIFCAFTLASKPFNRHNLKTFLKISDSPSKDLIPKMNPDFSEYLLERQ